jgi:kumamolisin
MEPVLDIDMIAGLAPLANILVYQSAGNQGYDPILQQIIQDNATPNGLKDISISWGDGESMYSTDYMSAIAQDIQVLTQTEHMTVFTSSGDCGAYENRSYPDHPAVDFPSSSPWAVAVGGTHLDTTQNGARSNETVWGMTSNASQTACDNSWGSGGGLSGMFKQSQWQSGSPGIQNSYSNGGRQEPDISAVADQLPVYYQGQWVDSGGTSAATPIWATGFLLANAALSYNKHEIYFGPSVFYVAAQHSGKWQPFYNVLQGNNRYYAATRGWNYCTGLGTPNLVDFYDTVLTYM